MKISISDIKINKRREVDKEKIQGLSGSIKEIGLLNPITVSKDNTLIAGAHRLEACKLLSWVDIECNVVEISGLYAELAEIDENLMRNELHYTEIGELAIRRDEILTALGNRATVGQGRPKNSAESAPLKTTADIAKDMGMSERTLQENKQIAKNLTPKVKEVIKEKEITKTEALKLARMEPEKQEAITQKLKSGEAPDLTCARLIVEKEERESSPIIITGQYGEETEIPREQWNTMQQETREYNKQLDRKYAIHKDIYEGISNPYCMTLKDEDIQTFLNIELNASSGGIPEIVSRIDKAIYNLNYLKQTINNQKAIRRIK